MATIGPTSSRAAWIAASRGRLPSWRWRSTFSTITIASSTTSPTESTIASRVSRLIVNPASEHEEDGAHQRDRDRHHRDEHGAHRAQEQEDHDDHDQQRLGQGLQHLVDRVLDVLGRVVGDPGLHPGRQLRLDLGHGRADLGEHVERVGGGQHPDAHEGRGLAVEADVLLVVLGARAPRRPPRRAAPPTRPSPSPRAAGTPRASCRSVLATRFTDTIEPLVWPRAER